MEGGGELESIKKTLFKIAMAGKWNEVVDRYKKEAWVQKAKITSSGDTLLHFAVSNKQNDVVAQMVEVVCQKPPEEALGIQNQRGHTALHFAASMGSVAMCYQIGKANSSLVGLRNIDGETPLFLAAFHGRKEAFLCLHYICSPETNSPPIYANCRRHDGDTILHCTIAGDYLDLAFQISNLYGDLVNWVNEEGFNPLHVLATKPSAFKSGSPLGKFENIIYHSLYVEKLQVEPYRQPYSFSTTTAEHKKKQPYPENYQTCLGLLMKLKNGIEIVAGKFPLPQVLINKFTGNGDQAPDLEAAPPGTRVKTQAHKLFPPNFKSCFDFVKFLCVALLVILGQGLTGLKKLSRKKEKHIGAVQILDVLLQRQVSSLYQYEDYGGGEPAQKLDSLPDIGDQQNDTRRRKMRKETPILIAAKNGVTEMVEKIFELFPVAAHDVDAERKNIVLLAVENRRTNLYQLLLQKKILIESLFWKRDHEGNSALHLAAKLGAHKPWRIPVAQMQWEIKWYEFVKESMPADFFAQYNKKNQTPKDIFSETHKELVKSGGEWLNKTAESCSVVAALIATVAFATSTTLPGGVKEGIGTPTLEGELVFNVFAVSSPVALCCSVTSVIMFLCILISRHQEHDFGRDLPRKLILGLTSLFISICAMLVSFCAAHFFVLEDKLRYAAFSVYAVTSLPVTFFALALFPMYFDFVWACFKKLPPRSHKASSF